MVNDEFAKYDFSQGINLDEVSAESSDNPDLTEALGTVVAALMAAMGDSVLEGYYAARIYTRDRSYVPKKGTIKLLPTGQVLFETDAYDDHPVYITLERDKVESILWYFDDEDEATEAAQAA